MSAYSSSLLQVLPHVLSVAKRCTKARRAMLYYFYAGMSYTRIVPAEVTDFQNSLTTPLSALRLRGERRTRHQRKDCIVGHVHAARFYLY